MVFRHARENFSIKRHVLFFERSDEAAVAHPAFSQSGIDAYCPQAPKDIFLVATMRESVISRMVERFARKPFFRSSCVTKSFGAPKDVAAPLDRYDASFYSRHGKLLKRLFKCCAGKETTRHSIFHGEILKSLAVELLLSAFFCVEVVLSAYTRKHLTVFGNFEPFGK